jgi:hypothetical protein
VTTSAVCPSCGCTQPDGLLCTEDTQHLGTLLAAIPAIVEQLDVAVSKQAKLSAGAKAGKGTAHTKSPVNWGAVTTRDALIVQATRASHPDIRRHPNAGHILANLGKAVKDAYRTIDRHQERRYLGTCWYEQDGLTCHAELWARPGAHQVVCSQCEVTHDVAERRAWLLQQAADRLVTPREASQYVGEVGGIEIRQQRIRNYLDRGRIPVRPTADGTKLLRLGDLLEILTDGAPQHAVRAS